MKNRIGFNTGFALLAFTIGLALLREFDFQTFTFRKTALGILYLVTFIFCIIFMLKKKNQQQEK
jgi:hypothetical protein